MKARISYLLMLQSISIQKKNNSEIEDYALRLGNTSKDFTINNMETTGLKRVANLFSVDFNPIDNSKILDIYIYLMKKKKKRYKIMFGLIKKKIFI